MGTWEHCIISYVDLIGIKKKIFNENGKGIDIMRQMHGIVHRQITDSMPSHDHAYCWNDSVLLLAIVGEHSDYELVMKEVNHLKREVDCISKSYVISVKGMVIPPLSPSSSSKSTYLKASSMALSNCFAIEKEFGRKYKKTWYIDSRITKHIKVKQKPLKNKVKMLPTNRERYICMYHDNLW